LVESTVVTHFFEEYAVFKELHDLNPLSIPPILLNQYSDAQLSSKSQAYVT